MSFVDKSLQFRKMVRRFLLGWIHPQTLDSENARAQLNAVLKEHWKPESIEVFELVLEIWEPDKPNDSTSGDAVKDNRFIVFIDSDFDVDWVTKSNGRDAASEKSISFAESIGARRCKHLPREQVLEFRRLIGQAIVNGIQGETEYSRELAKEAAQFLKDRTVERSRSWTLSSAHLFLLIFSGLLALFWELPRVSPLWQTENSFLLWLAVQGGFIGAYLSVIQKAGRGEWDAAAGRALHYIEVLTKLLAGGILGGIAFALSRSVLAPPALREVTPDSYSSLVLGIAAGLFERLIPKMISAYSKFEKTQNTLKE